MREGIIDDDSASPSASSVLIPMLKSSQAQTEARLQVCVRRLNVNIVDVARRVCVRRRRKDKPRTDQIRDLDADMIVAVSECGHFQDEWMRITCGLELLREKRMGNVDVFVFPPAVKNDESLI